MRISTSKSESIVLSGKWVEYLLWVGDEVLPQVEEFKFLRIFSSNKEKMEREVDRWMGAMSAMIQALYWSVVVKRELSQKA